MSSDLTSIAESLLRSQGPQEVAIEQDPGQLNADQVAAISSIWKTDQKEQDTSLVYPREPNTAAATGLAETLIEQLIMKAIYFRGDMVGSELAEALGLKFSILEPIVETFRRQQLITVKRSLGMGNVSAVLTLSEQGRERAQEYIETCHYSGRAPVPLDQYIKMVNAQRLPESWLTMDMLQKAYGHMVVTPDLLSQIGPAVNAGKSFLIYGQPGNGKTFLAEALFTLHEEPIYIPYAIECQGMIIQMYDPVYHNALNDTNENASIFRSTGKVASYDRRWFRAKRPFIVSGGELAFESLDLAYNEVAKTYDAPLHMKANNGIYLIDDFGRQKVSPAEVLNRWIVPMEKKVDFLTFQNGAKLQAPFEVFLVFSTNLNPEKLGDEAFLRRIQYKMLMKSPSEDEFKTIFTKFCEAKSLAFDPAILERFLEKHYRTTGKAKRRCHPRDILTHAIDLIRFERREFVLTEEVLDHAFLSCFIDTSENG
jgi:DNA-binding MarR family transcriptional regulator